MPRFSSELMLARADERMRELGLSESAVGKRAGRSASLIRNLRRGLSRSVNVETLQDLADALDVSPEWLAFGIGGDEEGPKLVPVLSWVAAGLLGPQAGVSEHEAEDHVAVAGLPKGGKHIALRVKGDSMDRIAPDGSLIVVDRGQREPIPGRYYVAMIGDEPTFKRYRASPARFEPYSTNPAHETIFPDDGVKVVGRVVRVMTEL